MSESRIGIPELLESFQRAVQSIPDQSIQLPPKAVCLELVELYFDYIHDQFHSLFHRPSFIEDVEKGRAPPVILFAILALSAR